MSVLAPPRPLDEFEQLVYEYTLRIGLGGDSDENNKYWVIDTKSCNLRFESATKGPPPQVSYLLTIPQNLCNYMGNLHGGCTATLIDILSTTILLGMSRPGVFALGGVSRHLKTTYLRPVPQGTEVRLTCTLVQMGKRLAFLRADISRVDNGDICVLGEHEKANTDPAEEKL